MTSFIYLLFVVTKWKGWLFLWIWTKSNWILFDCIWFSLIGSIINLTQNQNNVWSSSITKQNQTPIVIWLSLIGFQFDFVRLDTLGLRMAHYWWQCLQFLYHGVVTSIAIPPGWDASPLQVTPRTLTVFWYLLYTWVERGTTRVMCLVQEDNGSTLGWA